MITPRCIVTKYLEIFFSLRKEFLICYIILFSCFYMHKARCKFSVFHKITLFLMDQERNSWSFNIQTYYRISRCVYTYCLIKPDNKSNTSTILHFEYLLN